jgi:anti-sigma regulatory factor (Ser/Thr protein kinase)
MMLPDERSAATATPRRVRSAAPDVRVAISLPATVAAAADARRELQRSFGDALDAQELDDLLLVVSELVTNALLHGRGNIQLRVGSDGTRVAGTVGDDGQGFAYDPGGTEPSGDGGRGLNLVSQLTTRWGVRQAASDVWFELHAGSRR